MDDVNETAQRIKTRLGNLDETIKEKEAIDTDANRRIKRTMHAMAQKKVPAAPNAGLVVCPNLCLSHFVAVTCILKPDQFMDTMQHYQSVQNK